MATKESALAPMIGLFADVHGAQRPLRDALTACRKLGVQQIALLGDLFDRVEQADDCAHALAGWSVIGVWGNHEREIALAAAEVGNLEAATVTLLTGLGEELMVGDICFTHEATHWGHSATLARLSSVVVQEAELPGHAQARMTFAGHTHHRAARTERGPIDLGRRFLTIDPQRRYLINPGALAEGEYAVWDRESGRIHFHDVAW